MNKDATHLLNNGVPLNDANITAGNKAAHNPAAHNPAAHSAAANNAAAAGNAPAANNAPAAAHNPAANATYTMQHLRTDDSLQAASELQAFKSLESRSNKKRRKKRLRLAIIILVIVALAVAAWVVLPGLLAPEKKTQPILTDVVTRGTFADSIGGTGSLAAAEQVTVSSEVMGTVTDVLVNEGDTVEKGQLLFVIDNPDLERQVTLAERALENSKLGAAAATTAKSDAQRQAANAWQAYNDLVAQTDAARAQAKDKKQPFDEAAAKRELDAAYEMACAQDSLVVGAQQQIDSAAMTVADAQESLDRAKAQLEKRNVVAPISGQVIAQNLERGMDLKTLSDGGKAPMQLADRSQMSVTLSINETDILKLEVGQKATVTFSALPEYMAEATVRRIAPIADGSGNAGSFGNVGGMGGGQVVSYPVELLIEQPDDRLKIGMTAAAEISLRELKNVLLVNSLAVQFMGDNLMVYVQDAQGEINPVSVKVLEDNGSIAVVEGALNDGDIVVISGFSGISNIGAGAGMINGTTSGQASVVVADEKSATVVSAG